MSTDKDLDYNDEAVCPHCGSEQSDSWELGLDGDGDSTETDCQSCGESFRVELDLTVKYSTSLIPMPTCTATKPREEGK